MRFYRVLLLLYPASFRAEYSEDMCGSFRCRLRDASGLAAVLARQVVIVFSDVAMAENGAGELRQGVRQQD